METFTPVSAAVGGALIGLSATLLMLFNGRVAGISGIFAACINLRGSDKSWSAAFIAGLILAPLTAILVVSALSDKSTAIAALTLGARGFVAKPFTDDELKMALLEVTETR